MAETESSLTTLSEGTSPSQEINSSVELEDVNVPITVTPAVLEIPVNNPKYPVPAGALGNRPMAVSGFLQKRLQKGQKFFDSGDYNVAKSQKSSKPHINAGLPNPSAVVKRNLPSALLLQPNQDAPLPVLTPDDLPHHSHPAHEASKLLIDQVAPDN
ncbi:hypothetical protein BV898_05305 [Hypsibius exemplaris]|uniref:Alpha-endosulfine n=1 Tax=Hypsibius exemplaris TaxID=2072580 RepID=A0A1W0WZU7_HYPEX|nr:hypothetical protein BV898_05305 [Hypsibius exemplaris]